MLKGAGRFSLGGREETLKEGEALVAPAVVEHGFSNSAPDPLLILVLWPRLRLASLLERDE